MPIVSKLNIFPIKSCGGFAVTGSHVLPSGLLYEGVQDRRFMLVNPKGIFLSQRDYPKLAAVRITDTGVRIIIAADGMNPIDLPRVTGTGELRLVSVHKMPFVAIQNFSECSDWFSRYLETDCSLVATPSDYVRTREVPERRCGTVQLACHDSSPVHLISAASLKALNDEIQGDRIESDRFRANIVIDSIDRVNSSDLKPFEEEQWRSVTISGIPFVVRKPTQRCQVTAVDQKTGMTTKEPWTRIANWKRGENRATFGVYLVPLEIGKIDVGDDLLIERW